MPVINGLSDDYHPCQALADMLTIRECFRQSCSGLKLAFVGDGNNVAASVALACAHFGLDFSIATPEGYEMNAQIREQAKSIAERNGTAIDMHTRPQLAVADADVVYTDTWVQHGAGSRGRLNGAASSRLSRSMQNYCGMPNPAPSSCIACQPTAATKSLTR